MQPVMGVFQEYKVLRVSPKILELKPGNSYIQSNSKQI